MDKPVLKQVAETKFSLCVKFYTPDPGQLEEEFTRYVSFIVNIAVIRSSDTLRLLGNLFLLEEKP